LVCVALSACSWYAEAGHNQPEGNYVKVGVKGTFDVQNRLFTESLGSVVIDLSTINTTVTSTSGTFILSLTQNGQVIAAKSFPYVIIGNVAQASDPTAVQSWADGYPNADSAEVSLPNVQTVDGSGQTSSLTATAKYNGQSEASATASWTTSDCSRGLRTTKCISE
jgi:hypothetical protein